MAQSELEAAQSALSKLGAGTITALSDTTQEGLACNSRMDICKRRVLAMHPWNFSVTRSILSPTWADITNVIESGASEFQVTSATHGKATGDRVTIEQVAGTGGANGTFVITKVDANDFTLDDTVFGGTYTSDGRWTAAAQHAFAYKIALPTGCLRLLRVNDEVMSPDWRVEGRAIAANGYPLNIKYVNDVTDYATMSIWFYECLSSYMAWDICLKLSRSIETKQQLWEDFGAQLAKARFEDASEDPAEQLSADDWIESRFANVAGPVRDPKT